MCGKPLIFEEGNFPRKSGITASDEIINLESSFDELKFSNKFE